MSVLRLPLVAALALTLGAAAPADGAASGDRVKDQKPGNRTGDGFNSVWRVARP